MTSLYQYNISFDEQYSSILSAGVSMSICALVFNPLEVWKINKQTTSSNLRLSQYYRGAHLFAISEFINGAARIGLFPFFKNMYNLKNEFQLNLLSSLSSGVFGAFISQPFEVIRHMGQKNMSDQNLYKKLKDAYKYKPLLSNLGRAGIITATQLTTYESFKNIFISYRSSNNSLSHCTCGFISGLMSSIVGGPIDSIRTHLFLYGNIRHLKLNNMFNGVFPMFCRLGPLFTISFPMIEFFKRQVF